MNVKDFYIDGQLKIQDAIQAGCSLKEIMQELLGDEKSITNDLEAEFAINRMIEEEKFWADFKLKI